MSIKTVYINTISAFLPNEAVENADIEKVLGQAGKKPSRAKNMVLRSNQIKTRYYAIDRQTREPTHTNATLAANAIEMLKCDIENIDLLVCGTTLPDQLMPNHALMVHGELGRGELEVVATAGVCLSGIAALKYAYLSIKSDDSSLAIASASENASSVMRSENFAQEIESRVEQLKRHEQIAFEKDFLRWMLSDGAGAMLLSSQPNSNKLSLQIEWIDQRSYAHELDSCMYAGSVKMDDGSLKGWRQYAQSQWLQSSIFSVKQDVKLLNDKIIEYTVTLPLKKLLESKKLDPSAIDWYLPHYSSGFFRDKVYDGMLEAGCDIPQDRWFTNLSSKGNTGSASIYIMLEELFNSDRLKSGDTILCYIPESSRFSTAFMQLKVV